MNIHILAWDRHKHVVVLNQFMRSQSIVYRCAIHSGVYGKLQEEIEDTKGVIRSCKSNDRKFNGQIMIYKILHRKPKIEQHEPHWKPEMKLGVPEEVSNFCFTGGTCQATLVINPVKSHE
jgi:hypothetical protein